MLWLWLSRSIEYFNNYALIGTEAATAILDIQLTDTALHWEILTGNQEREIVLFSLESEMTSQFLTNKIF